MKVKNAIAFMIISLCCASCTTLPDDQSILESVQFIGSLRDRGLLPGVKKGDRGEFSAKGEPKAWNSEYPLSVMVYLTLPIQNTKYVYQLTKGSKYIPWMMIAAWGYDDLGQKTELNVPSIEEQLKANAH